MREKFFTLLLVLLLATTPSAARFPQPGDGVWVVTQTQSGLATVTTVYQGNITEIKDGLLCLNCTGDLPGFEWVAKFMTQYDNKYEYFYLTPIKNNTLGIEIIPPVNICIGTANVVALVWADECRPVMEGDPEYYPYGST